MRILVVGGGGREHALCLSLARSPLCGKLYAAPGNPGIGENAELVPIEAHDVAELVSFADENEIDFVVVGPEVPLALGLVDALTRIGILAFGPTQAAAQLEASKAFTKILCRRHGIPTAEAEIFTDADEARAYVRKRGVPIVIKADGLAAGKGVVVARTLDQAEQAIDAALVGGTFGEAGATLVIEQFLAGQEVSFFALVDGHKALAFGSAQDHKAAFDGDLGPNTGGMGAYSPAPVFTPDIEALAMRDIIAPTVRAMAENGTPFRGILFAGLMIVGDRPYLIEYNTRFGDPECEVLLARLGCDLLPLLLAAAGGELGTLKPAWANRAAISVVMAAKGYPGPVAAGTAINNLGKAGAIPDVDILHAGTAVDAGGHIVAAGGRVLVVTATGPTLLEARNVAYAAADAIDWKEGFFRRDIGWRALDAEMPQGTDKSRW